MNAWPGGHRHGMYQDEHREWNAKNYPGTRQLCEECGGETGRCEDDSLFLGADNEIGPLCEDCYRDICGVISRNAANLISAAPDLFDALQTIYGKLLMSDRDGDAVITKEDGLLAEAALAKATGAA